MVAHQGYDLSHSWREEAWPLQIPCCLGNRRDGGRLEHIHQGLERRRPCILAALTYAEHDQCFCSLVNHYSIIFRFYILSYLLIWVMESYISKCGACQMQLVYIANM